ncbi:Endonuclease/exonuclease/phosphatase [Geranomyces variabilis]|nr:Endonuclease/exonuclease/phosphatase [Geranomyces variabilis]KAJ3143654.1 Glucose-repressible alcohol dehydrogenase transcriptional effector [Geranomyces variabilis]
MAGVVAMCGRRWPSRRGSRADDTYGAAVRDDANELWILLWAAFDVLLSLSLLFVATAIFWVGADVTLRPLCGVAVGLACMPLISAAVRAVKLWTARQERLAHSVLPTVIDSQSRSRHTTYSCELPCVHAPLIPPPAGNDEQARSSQIQATPLYSDLYVFPERPYRKDSGFDDAVPAFATAGSSAKGEDDDDQRHISIVVHTELPTAEIPDSSLAKSEVKKRHSTLSIDAEPYTPLGATAQEMCVADATVPPISVVDSVRMTARHSAASIDHTQLSHGMATGKEAAERVSTAGVRRYDQATLLSLRPRAADVSRTLRIPAQLRAAAVEAPLTPTTPPLLRGPDNCPLLPLPPSLTSPHGNSSAACIPLRRWTNAHSPSAEEFSVMTWNVLAPMYCTREKFPDLSDSHRDWGHRRSKVLDEVAYYASDVMCLQEVTLDDFENFFAPKLHMMGYAGVYREKARAPAPLQPSSPTVSSPASRTPSPTLIPAADGCALFYNTATFTLLDIDTFSYPELAARYLPATHDVSVDVLRFANTGIHALFMHVATGNRVRVVTTHLHWNPANERTKLLQAALLMEYLAAMTSSSVSAGEGKDRDCESVKRMSGGRRPRSHGDPSTQVSLAGIPIVLAGDLNSMRGERVHQFLESGATDVSGDWGWADKEYGAFSTASTLPEPTVSHKAKLASAYGPAVLSYTNKTPTFAGTIDHVFYTPATLAVRDVLGPVVDGWLDEVKALPTASVVSDHLPLGVWMAWKGNGSAGGGRGGDRGRLQQPRERQQQQQQFAIAAGCGQAGGAAASRVRNQKQKQHQQHQQQQQQQQRSRAKLSGRPQSWRAVAPAADSSVTSTGRKDATGAAGRAATGAKKTRRRTPRSCGGSATPADAGRNPGTQ